MKEALKVVFCLCLGFLVWKVNGESFDENMDVFFILATFGWFGIDVFGWLLDVVDRWVKS